MNEQLKIRTIEHGKKVELAKQLKASWDHQEADLKRQIYELEREVKISEELLKSKMAQTMDKKSLDEAKAKVSALRAELDKLSQNKAELDSKRSELHDSITALAKDRDQILKRTAELEKQKEISTASLKKLESEGKGLGEWIKFLDLVYEEFLNNRELFGLRQQFRQFIFNPGKSLNEKYNFLVSNANLKKFSSRILQKESMKNDEALRRETFEKCFRNILAEPELIKTQPDTAVITGVNLDLQECFKALEEHVRDELAKVNLKLSQCSKDEQLYLDARRRKNSDPALLEGRL